MRSADPVGQQESYDSRIVQVRRTAKVRDGGKDMSFRALAVVGDGKGHVGYGSGKAKEVVDAVRKAHDHARRNMVAIALRKDTLQHPLLAHYGATKVFMRPAVQGTGIIAGGAMRAVFEVLGVRNVISKCIGSKNPFNVVRASIDALSGMSTLSSVARRRGKTYEEIVGVCHADGC